MSNTFITSDLVSKKVATNFMLSNALVMNANHDYTGMYSENTYEPGDTVSFKLGNKMVSQRGDVVTATDVIERKMSMTIQPLYSVYVTFKPTDLQRHIDDVTKDIIEPAVQKLSADINADLAIAATTQLNYFVGTPGAPIADPKTIQAASAFMRELAIPPGEWNAVMSINDRSTLKGAFPTLFTPNRNEQIIDNGEFNHMDVFDIWEDNQIQSITPYAEAMGTPVVKTNVTSGNQIIVEGLTASKTGIYKKGDCISIPTVYSVDPVKKNPTSKLMQYVVQADADSDSGGETILTINDPSMSLISSITNPNQNISVLIPAGAAVYRGKQTVDDGTKFKVNVAYNKRGLCVCLPPLEPFYNADSSVVNQDGISFRVSRGSVINRNENTMRIDAQAAYSWIPEFAIKLLS